MPSVWSDSCTLQKREPLKSDTKADVVIIGGGMAGILCAYYLKNAGIDCVITEAETCGRGVTQNTTAKITAQHRLIYHKIINSYGAEKASLYLEANLKAVENFKKLCEGIDCDFEVLPSYVYAVNSPKKLQKEAEALQRLHSGAEYAESIPLPFTVDGAVRLNEQAQFNPLKFLEAISRELKIYENTRALKIEDGKVITNRGSIDAQKIIVATHFPFLNKHGSYFLKLYQHRSYSIAFENAENYNGMYVDDADTGFSFRNYKDLLIIGGGGHRTGAKGGCYTAVEGLAALYYPKATAKYRFAAQDCMSLDSLPYIGHYSKRTEDVYVATGFSKWGMSGSMVAAQILCNMVCGRAGPYREVFSPQRGMIKPQLFKNGFHAVKNLLTISDKRCPHMGCALKWNRAEHSWDCPCHGSRFSENGRLLDNPATGDVKFE